MASTKLVYMPQDSSNSVISQYFPDPNLRGPPNKTGLWATAPLASPQSSNAAAGSVWASPLSVLSGNTHSLSSAPVMSSSTPLSSGSGSALRAVRTSSTGTVADIAQTPAPRSLAALTADSEPVASHDVEFYAQSVSSASSHLSSQQSSLVDPTSPTLSTSPIASMGSANNLTAVGSTLSANLGSGVTRSAATQGSQRTPNDEIINTAIVVKNIPFAIKKEQLIDFMTQLGLPLPYAFNYHFDNGVFRGLAFANFASADETTAVISSLNGRELGGRKLRVEYKKMLPYQERERIEREKRERRGQLEEQHLKADSAVASQSHARPGSVSSVGSVGSVVGSPGSHHPSLNSAAQFRSSDSQSTKLDMNDPETLELFRSLLLFKHDALHTELVIPPAQTRSFSAEQISLLTALSDQLELSCGIREEQGIVVSKTTNTLEDRDFYFTGILRHAIAVPANSAVPVRTPSQTQISAINQGFNRWNGVS